MMPVRLKGILLPLLLVTNLAQAAAELQIMGPAGEQTVSLPEGARLADALLLPQVQPLGYRPCARISTPQLDQQLQAQKQALLSRLDKLHYQFLADSQRPQAMAVKQLKQQLDSLVLHAAIRVSLDPDRLRIRKGENLRLEGSYRLYLPSCEPGLTLLGAVANPGPQPLIAGQWLADYLNDQQEQPWAESSWAWYLAGQDDAVRVGLDGWNRKHREASAGAVLFVGFDAGALPAGYEDINQAIVSLLQQGMGLQP
ncbi:capsule biosynthesis GfcC D2 domain-containing protein [Pseudaeromonas paramecii]|uniref:Capsule biosynthesis GfcC-like C-terminal domain-containing protein n=1 Tax=Pseudaeromonas paramecii TaxID=2138166 RepID=A0ABP8Q4Y4_9GAMM